MKTILKIIFALFIGFVIGAFLRTSIGAVTSRSERTLLPETTATYSLGSTAKKWLDLWTTNATTTNLSVTGLANCDTIDTDASGNTRCGTDSGGSGSVAQLGQIGDVSTTTLAYGSVIRYNTATSKWESVATSTLGISGSGTVTSVNMSVPTGLSISGNPVTTAGTLALTYTSGYAGVLTASTTNWNNFYDTPSTRITDGLGLTWSTNTLNCDTASGSIFGCLASADWTTFNSKQATISATYPLVLTGATLSTPLATTTIAQTYGTGQLGAVTFATSSDTNLGLNITNTNGAFTFTPTWIGTLANARLTNSTISGKALGTSLDALTATNGTLTFSGSYDGSTARTVGLNLGNANAWTATGNTTFVGNVGIGTTSPYAKLSVVGETVASHFTATTTSTSTIPRLETAGLNLTNFLTFNGVTGSTWASFCTTITGGSGLCDGTDDGGAGSGSNWNQQTNYNVSTLTPTTTIPVWIKSGLYASSTVNIKSNQLSTHASLGFFDLQRDAQTVGNGYTLMRIKSPTGASEESTLSLLNDLDNNNSGVNESFIDFYNENYADSNQAGIRAFNTGTAPTKPFVFGYCFPTCAKDNNNVFGMLPNGTFWVSRATSTVDTSSKFYVSSSTATYVMKVDSTPGTNLFSILPSGRIGIGTTTPRWSLQIASSTAPQLALSDGSLTSNHWTMRNAGGNLYIATSSPSTYATSSVAAMQLQPGSTSLGIGTTSPWRTLSVVGTMAITAPTNSNTGDYLCWNTTTFEVTQSATACSLSSIRWKQNIREIDGGLENILKLHPILYDLKPKYGTAKDQPGFIAEEALKATPKLVSYGKDGQVSGYDYPKLTAYLTKAVQELNTKIENLTVGKITESAQDKWQWLVVGLLVLWIIRLEIKIRK